jgi:hypothetical protein
VWRTTKFITSVPQENRFAKAILDNLDIPGYQGQGAVVATARASWLAIYQDRCLNKLNCVRSYVIGRMREVCFDLMTLKNEPILPTAEEILACATRRLMLTRQYLLGMSKLVYRATGNKHHWADSKKFFRNLPEA